MDWAATLTTSQAIREILLSVALLVGGGWALYRYWYLERRDAQLELRRLESQIGLSSYLNIEIVHVLRQGADDFDLIGDVRISNPGTRSLTFDLMATAPIRISKVQLRDDGQYSVSEGPLELGFLSTEEIRNCEVEGKGNASLKFVARLEGPAIYLVEFWSRIAETAKADSAPFTSWMSSQIVDVSAEAAAAGQKQPMSAVRKPVSPN